MSIWMEYEYGVRCTYTALEGTEPTVEILCQSHDRALVERWLERHRANVKHDCVLVRRPVQPDWEEVPVTLRSWIVETKTCPVHGLTDCSPLLNGCSRLTA